MSELASIFVRIGADLGDFDKKIQQANGKLNSFKGAVNRLSNTVQGQMNTALKNVSKELQILENRQGSASSKADMLKNKLNVQKSAMDDLKASIKTQNEIMERMKTVYGENSAQVQKHKGKILDLELAYDKLQAEIGQTESQLKGMTGFGKLNNHLKANAEGLQTFGENAVLFGGIAAAGMVAGLGAVTKKAMDFEAQMSSVSALLGSDGRKDLQKYKDLAIEMGADTKFSAMEAAQGIEELIKAGVSSEAILGGGLKGALDLAVAGDLELAEAAEIASTALNAFRKDNLSVARAGDILAGAANASATSVGELKFGLSMVGAVAAGLGLTFEDTNTALAVLAQNGIKGSDAGTSLKTMLSNLIPKSNAAFETMKELGIVTEDGSNNFFDAQGNVKNMAQISDVLSKSLEGMTAEQKQAALYTMFGSDAIRAATVLANEGATGINNMNDALNKVTAAEVAKEKLNNLKGEIEQLKGATETAAITLGSALMPVLAVLVGVVQKVVNWFNNLSPAAQKFVAMSLLVVTALTILTVVVGALAIALGFLATAEWAVIAPILPIIAAIALVVVAIGGLAALIYANWGSIAAFASTIWGAIKSQLTGVWNAIVSFGKQIFGQFKTFWQTNGQQLSAIASTIWNAIRMVIHVNMSLAKAYLMTIWAAIKLVVLTVWGAIKTIVSSSISFVLGTIQAVMQVLKGDWSGAWNTISSTAQTIWGNIKSFFSGQSLYEAGAQIIQGLVNGISSMAGAAVRKAQEIASSVVRAAKNILDINSPSRVFFEIGQYTAEGLAGGMEKSQNVVSRASEVMTSAAISMPNIEKDRYSNYAGTGMESATLNIPLYVDGKEIARATAPFVGKEIDTLIDRRNRMLGGARIG